MNKFRAASEAEVIWEFLRNEFHHHDFDRDRDRFAAMVESGDANDPRQDALRRALFYRRRGHMWNQIPRDTQWWRVQLEDSDLDRLCVFARTHWRKIGGRNCLLRHVVEQIRARDFHGVRVVGGTAHGGVEISDVGSIVDGVRAFSRDLAARDDRSAVVLIGINDELPVTILEGNHRLTAALLVSPELLKSRFRMYFGASPRMAQCCWYGDPTVANMLRYAANRLKHFGNREADVGRLVAELDRPGLAPPYAAPDTGTAMEAK
ncbi:MAG: hypothetical protein ACR2IF_02520 [Terriglobales bacterium]